MGSIMNLFVTAFTAVSSWFTNVLDSSGMGAVFLGAIFISILFRRLIVPIFGYAGSDRAKKSNKNKEE